VLRTLRSRNIALLVAVVVAGQILSFVLIWALAIRPQAERVGGIMARNVAAISRTMDRLPPQDRQALIADINRGGAIRILPGDADPPEDRGLPSLLERIFVDSFAREMASDEVVIWRGSQSGQLWVRVPMGGDYWWMSYERPPGWSPNGALLASFAIAVSLALIGGILLQRRIARPLRAVADAADALSMDSSGPDLPTDGPREIATVSQAFNHMRTRLSEQERERAFMLAGISHDLRTPLAKIRLLTAMIPNLDADTEAMLSRQYDQMDQMLAQFLDFARAQQEEALALVEVGTMTREVADGLGIAIEQVGVDRLELRARPIALRRALTNLLRNASLYGCPPIMLELAVRDGHAIIGVRDHGDGVAEDRLDELARPFVRGDDARPSDGGTGLGLAIVRHVAAAHGGSLRISNPIGGGLLVELALPAA
jgi:two-component system, OmpR family, osmolarity sensor histidine kinase EnvZ